MNRRTHRRFAAVALLIPLLSGCEAQGETRAAVVRDSAGIRIVENTSARWAEGEQWRVSDRPLLSLGAADGPPESQFHLVVGVHRLRDGTIVVVNRGTSDIRYYSSGGDLVRRVGRRGAGPGEFDLLYWSSLVHDTLFAYDAGLRRVTVLDPLGELVRTFSLESLHGSWFAEPVGRLGGGAWLAKEPQFMGDLEGLVRLTDHYLLVGEKGGAEALLDLWGEERLLQGVGAGGGAYVRSAPFARIPSARVRGTGFIYGSAETYEFVEYAVDGRPTRLIRRSHTPQPVTSADLRRWQSEYEDVRDPLPPGLPQFLYEPASELPLPAHRAAHGPIQVDALNMLWVADYSFPRQPAEVWSVFDSAGVWLGEVATPKGFEVFEIGTDYLIGVFKDDLAVESIRLYRLDRDPSRVM